MRKSIWEFVAEFVEKNKLKTNVKKKNTTVNRRIPKDKTQYQANNLPDVRR